MLDISIIIVSYNVKEYLEKALISIYNASSGINKEIFVVDNNSSDGSVEMIKEKFKDIILIENNRNLGFSKANNIALKRCAGKYILLINPDTIINADTLHKMSDFFNKTPDCGIAGCKILNTDKSLQLACRRAFPSLFTSFSKIVGLSKLFPKSKLFGKYNLTYLDSDKISEVDSISGSFMFVRSEVLKDIGYLDEDFFLYAEDLDWCYRIGKKGWKVYYYPETEIIHFKGRSSINSDVDTEKEFYRSMSLFVEKHFKTRYLFFPLWFIKFGIWIRLCLSFFSKIFKKIKILKNNEKKLIIVSNNHGIEIYRSFKNNNFVGILDISNSIFINDTSSKKLDGGKQLRKIIIENKVNKIVVSSNGIMPEVILKIMNICSGLRIKFELVSKMFN